MSSNNQTSKQMSDSILLGAILSLAGGFQDAYSYNCRGAVFANAQTGNIVLLGQNMAAGNWNHALRYAFPIFAFAFGVYISEWVKYYYKERSGRFHWRQITLLIEIIIMILAGALPHRFDTIANVLLSFACAIQVNSFRKFGGIACATTMCIGNIRSGTELLSRYMMTKEKTLRQKSFRYYSIICFFAIGAVFGFLGSLWLKRYAIWIAAGIVAVGFFTMFLPEKNLME